MKFLKGSRNSQTRTKWRVELIEAAVVTKKSV
jgi:hypothetical protein